MDIFKFINSNSVARYLKDIGYTFSPQEAAFLVYHSRKATAKTKLKAWTEIIETMSDSAVVCRFDYPQYDSLHSFLRKFMLLVNRIGLRADASKLGDDDYYLYTAFDYMWFDIPAPFKKGDIVYNVTDKTQRPFVITDLSYWDECELRANGCTDRDCDFSSVKNWLENRAHHDYSDMCAHGYVSQGGEFAYDWQWNYLDFEYCDKALVTENRELLLLSKYLQGQINLEKFLNLYLLLTLDYRL